MDPTETFRLWQLAVLEENQDDANEHYSNLLAWLASGGFEPWQWYNENAKKQFLFQYNPETGKLDK